MAIDNKSESRKAEERGIRVQWKLLWLDRFVGLKFGAAIGLDFDWVLNEHEWEEPQWSKGQIPLASIQGYTPLHFAEGTETGILRYPQRNPEGSPEEASVLIRRDLWRSLDEYLRYIQAGQKLGMDRKYLDWAIGHHIK